MNARGSKSTTDRAARLALPAAPLSEEMERYFAKCDSKLGFVPNVLKAYAFDWGRLEAFVKMVDDLMLGDSALTKLEREMIAVVVSSVNHCHYCLVSHGAAVRYLSGDAHLGDTLVANYRAAEISDKQRAMLDFAWKITASPADIDEGDRQKLRDAGFSDRDIWDIVTVAGFFNMSNRVAGGVGMEPNAEYYGMAR